MSSLEIVQTARGGGTQEAEAESAVWSGAMFRRRSRQSRTSSNDFAADEFRAEALDEPSSACSCATSEDHELTRAAQTSLGAEWEASAKATPSIGFLDLSKEIRDMIYQEICADLKRIGIEWKKTAPKDNEEESADHVNPYPWWPDNRDEPDKPAERPSVPADCSIMRTCRQIHAEFASVLYGSPIHLSPEPDKGKNTIPISPVYAGLVRAVFCGRLHSEDIDNPHTWWWYLSVATGLTKMFPNAVVLRLGWYSYSREAKILTMAAIGPEAWGVAVRQTNGAIKTVRSMSNTPLVVPHNLEVVKFYKKEREAYVAMSAPVMNAVVQMRAKKRQRKAGRLQAAYDP